MTTAALAQTRSLDRRLAGFGPVGIAAMLVVAALGPLMEPLGALLALLWAKLSQTPLRAIGFARPKSWVRTIALGILSGAAFKLVMKAVVMPLLGAPDVNPTYHWLAGNTAALPSMISAVTIGAGFGEETVFRGFLFERLGKLFRGSTIAVLIVTSVYFGAVHYPGQGIYGAEQALITGLVWGSIYAATGNIWLPMISHAFFDIVAVGIIYFDIEPIVAHLVF